MGKGRIRLLKVAPGPRNVAAIVAEFCSEGGGVITALSDNQLRTLRGLKPIDADVDLESFGSIVSTWAKLAGQDPLALAQTGHLVAAIGAVCQTLPAHSPFGKSRVHGGLHERLAGTIKNLGGWRLDPDLLDELATESSPHLAAKLAAIADIQRQAEEMLSDLGRDLNYRHIDLCLESVPTPMIPFPRCLLFADASVQPSHVEWMNWAVSNGTDLTVVVEHHPAHPNLYPAARYLEETLTAHVFEVGETSAFIDGLFTDRVVAEPGLEVRAFYAADPLAEVEWALRGCLAAADEGGYGDLGIYARNLEEYAPLIESAAMRLNVPIQLSRRAALLTNSFIKILLDTLKGMVAHDLKSINRLARSSYANLSHAQRKEIDEALLTALHQGDAQWPTMLAWSLEREIEFPWLAALLRWWQESAGAIAPVGVWIQRLGQLMDSIFLSIGEGATFERDSRARHSLDRALAQQASIEHLSERADWGLPRFVWFVERVAQDADTSLPTKRIGVQIASAAEEFRPVRRLYVLGMLEGSFPRRRSEDPILTDQDIREINEKREMLFPIPDSFDRARAERDEFLSVCSIPSETLVFSFPETTDDRDNIRAFYLEEVKRVLGGRLEWPRFPRQELAPALEECVATSDKEIRVALGDERQAPIELRFTDPATRERLAASRDEAVSPRELRTAIECPFRHFAADLLRLYPDRQRRRWHQLRSLPAQSQLTTQHDPASAREALDLALQTELDRLRMDIPDWELNVLERGGQRLIDEWLEREFRAREIWPKDPGSERVSVHFGQEGLRDELPRVGAIEGSVAGVSRMGPYKVIHLVESNTPNADKTSPIRLKDRDALYYGLHLLAAFDRDSAMAVEIESMSGGRRLLLLPRVPEPPLIGDVERGLEVLDLGSEADPAIVRKIFFDKVKELLEKASRAIRSVDVQATKGEHCQWCDYGELCRSSSEFGEDESPFEEVYGD